MADEKKTPAPDEQAAAPAPTPGLEKKIAGYQAGADLLREYQSAEAAGNDADMAVIRKKAVDDGFPPHDFGAATPSG